MKAGSKAYESRDTGHPALIGDLLMALLEANGNLHASPITEKHVRDDVVWAEGAELPWRRSATWLVLRVALQRMLSFSLGGPSGLLMYKLFIAFFLSTIRETPLAATPYSNNLNDVLVYYDESHTRGTDLQLPTDAQAVLTLGLGQAKDATVQGKKHFPTPIKQTINFR